MTNYYPAFLTVKDRKCVIVGGGSVAQRKAKSLLDCGARVTVISPQVSPSLQRIIEAGKAVHLKREYQLGDSRGAFLLIAATDDRELNRQIGQEARKDGALVNVVDDPEYCDFIAPSIMRRGDITFAISTAGRSPALARRIREQLQRQFPKEYAQLATLLSEVREELKRNGEKVSPRRWQLAIDSALLQLLKEGRKKEAKIRLMSSLRNGKKFKRNGGSGGW